MGDKDPKSQTMDEWTRDYEAEEMRLYAGNDIEKWVQIIMSKGSQFDRGRALMACPEDMRRVVRAEVQRQWDNRGRERANGEDKG